jgi:hypothetical protein
MEEPCVDVQAPNPHGLFVLFDRNDVAHGAQDVNYRLFNQHYNGFATFQSHRYTNAVQTYIWPEDVTNDIGLDLPLRSHSDLISHGRSVGLKSLFDCVPELQGEEDWWWELSRRCRLNDQNSNGLPKDSATTLGGKQDCFLGMGEKASSLAFESWFDAVRYQIAHNLFRMGIFGGQAENFLDKVRMVYARREPYRYSSVYTEVEGVPVLYLGDSAGSTDFKKGMSCGRGLICAAKLAISTMHHFAIQQKSIAQADLRCAFQIGGMEYQQDWNSMEMKSEWRDDFDPSYKYCRLGRIC